MDLVRPGFIVLCFQLSTMASEGPSIFGCAWFWREMLYSWSLLRSPPPCPLKWTRMGWWVMKLCPIHWYWFESTIFSGCLRKSYSCCAAVSTWSAPVYNLQNVICKGSPRKIPVTDLSVRPLFKFSKRDLSARFPRDLLARPLQEISMQGSAKDL